MRFVLLVALVAAQMAARAAGPRQPVGNFVSGYNWKDGIGDRDKRPPRKNPAWTGIEHNDFGMHEYFSFIRELNTQPFIALNAGLGSAESAAQEVQYVNGASDTPMGKLRAANGHPEPLDVAAAWAKDKKVLTISIVNPTYESQRLGFKLVGARPTARGKAWVLTGLDDMAYNEPGKDPAVRFAEKSVSGYGDMLEVSPVSATIFHVRVR
jgi:hypothetical protein